MNQSCASRPSIRNTRRDRRDGRDRRDRRDGVMNQSCASRPSRPQFSWCARDACDHQLVVPAFSRHPVRPQLQLGRPETHAITNSPAGLQPASCQAPASAGRPETHAITNSPAGLQPASCQAPTSAGAQRCMRSPTLLPAFSRHPVRPQLQLGLSEASAQGQPASAGFSCSLQASRWTRLPGGACISLAEAN